MPSSANELLTLAFRLAFFVHRDRATALRVATEAFAKLEVAAAAQDKRLYYTPTGRSASDAAQHGQRTKVAMEELHLLQRLVYVESDSFERDQERSEHLAALDEEDMVVRFIKHLIRITTRRNSFYVTLGLGRLLFSYSTAETASMYNSVIQDCERMKDDYYYRSRKRKLIQELHERFGELIKLQRVKHGEERFEVSQKGTLWSGLVQECLAHFTPWKTNCVIPEKWDPVMEELPELGFQGDDPDNEHPVEIRRMHSVVHPDCFARLAKAHGYEDPAEKLTVPRFFIPKSESGPPKDRGKGVDLSDAELALVQGEMSDRASRRRSYSAGLLRIMVDGVERRRFDPRREKSVQVQLGDADELVEVLGEQGGRDILLATHLLSLELEPGETKLGEQQVGGAAGRVETSVTLEAGQQVTFSLQPQAAAESGVAGSLEVAYAETRFLRGTLLSGKKALAWLSGKGKEGSKATAGRRYAPAMALGLALLLTSAAVITIFMHQKQRARSSGEDIARNSTGAQNLSNTRPPRSSVPQPSAAGSQVGPSPQAQGNQPQLGSLGKGPRLGGQRHQGDGGTRVIGGPKYGSIPLERVRAVFVDPLGEGAFADSVRGLLGTKLSQTGRFTLASKRDDAQAVFKGEASPEGTTGRGHLSLKLIAPDGSTIWKFAATGTPEELAGTASQDLVQRAEGEEKDKRK
ncbi:MAG TPA: hypothetical protein VEZ90_19035 [Blastocatellia bacterium]|nr:hypothetical protein [Blastocatellia bacterium]